MSDLRLFTAVELTRSTREALVRRADALLAAPAKGTLPRWWRRGLSPVPPRNLHVTVRFLGGVAEERVPGLVDALREAASAVPAGRVRLAALGAFPTPARPRVVWCGVNDAESVLTTLESAVSSAVAPLGIPPESRPYHPHVTLARVRDGRVGRVISERLRATRDGEPFHAGPLPVERLTLFESTTSRADRSRGPHYEPLEHIDLNREAP